MNIKTIFAAAALTALSAPAFAQSVLTAAQCTGAGGVINQAAGTCSLTPDQLASVQGTTAAGTTGATGLGAGLGGAAGVGVGLAIVVAAADGSSTTTTTTGS